MCRLTWTKGKKEEKRGFGIKMAKPARTSRQFRRRHQNFFAIELGAASVSRFHVEGYTPGGQRRACNREFALPGVFYIRPGAGETRGSTDCSHGHRAYAFHGKVAASAMSRPLGYLTFNLITQLPPPAARLATLLSSFSRSDAPIPPPPRHFLPFLEFLRRFWRPSRRHGRDKSSMGSVPP